MLRWCISSPMRSAWPIERAQVDAAAGARAPRPAAGPASVASQRRRADHLVVVGAEAQHRAEPLVDGGEGAVAARRGSRPRTPASRR